MDNATHLGLDVHKDTIAVAILRPGEAEPDERTIANTPKALRAQIRRGSFEHSVACYEAGPTGYETHRLLTSLGVSCDVIAPTMIPRRAGARIKTDRIDARNLARLHRAGELTPIRVPSPAEEAIRDLVRVREDIKDDRRKTQHRVKAFLLRQGRRYPGRDKGWSDKFDLWARSQRFEEPASDAAYRHYLAALDVRRTQLATITAEIEVAAKLPPLAVPVAKLRCLRGIETLSAVSITAEVCDFRRFPGAPSFMAFTGLVPSEHSSGPSVHRAPSPRPATHTSAACSSRLPGATGTAPRSGSTCVDEAKGSHPRSSPTHGRHSVGSSPGSTPSPRRRTATSPSWRSRESSPGSSGVS